MTTLTIDDVSQALTHCLSRREELTRLRGMRVRIEHDVLYHGASFEKGAATIDWIDTEIARKTR